MSRLEKLARRGAQGLRHVDLVFPHWIERAVLRGEQEDATTLPLIAIIGPPRVGSTLAYQLLAGRYEVAYFDNLQHTFLRYPLLGWMLAQRRNGPPELDLRSDHGFVSGLRGLSEANFFWPYWFDQQQTEAPPRPDPKRVGHALRFFDHVASKGRPLVTSFNAHAFYMAELAELFERVIFVSLRRDPLASAVSILRGRREVMGNEHAWWSGRPARCRSDEDPYRQVVCQLMGTYQAIAQRRVAHPDLITVGASYEEICRDPAILFGRVETAADRAGFELERRPGFEAPELAVRSPDPTDPDVARLADLIAGEDWDVLDEASPTGG